MVDAAGNRVGTTPTEIALPIDGHEIVLHFRHPLAGESEKRFIPSGDTAFDIELPPAPLAPAQVSAAEAGTARAPPAVREPPPEPEKHRPRRRKKVRRDLLRPEF